MYIAFPWMWPISKLAQLFKQLQLDNLMCATKNSNLLPVLTYCLLSLSGGCGVLDIQPHWVTALTWPLTKGPIERVMGLSVEHVLVGRLDGSLAFIEVYDASTFKRKELEHCYRKDGNIQ